MTYVLVGAGGLGRKMAAAMKPHLYEVVAFADRNPAKQRTRIDGVPVFGLADAVQRFPDATFVVTIWGGLSDHRIAATELELRHLGVSRLEDFGALLRRFGLSHYFMGAIAFPRFSDRLKGCDLFTDPESLAVFRAHERARHECDVTRLPEPIAGPVYFRPELFTLLGKDEVVIDGGAYDGDTLRAFVAAGHTCHRWLCFEPHPEIAERLDACFTGLPESVRRHVEGWRFALGAKYGQTWFTDDATMSAAGVGAGDPGAKYPVQVLALDAFPEIAPTFIKLDIEGAELDAIAGMSQTILAHRPVLAVCVYHRPADLWRIPLVLKELLPDAKFYLRAHGPEGWETVCYAVPPEREP